MGQWSLKERLQPSLLDRLTDHQPEKSRESSAQQSMSQTEFKNAVIRDLGWLLNSVALDVCVDLTPYPQIQNSVLNYGLPDLSGHTSSTIDVRSLEKSSHNSLVFEIDAAVFGQPSPFQVVLKSELDLESNQFQLTENFDG